MRVSQPSTFETDEDFVVGSAHGSTGGEAVCDQGSAFGWNNLKYCQTDNGSGNAIANENEVNFTEGVYRVIIITFNLNIQGLNIETKMHALREEEKLVKICSNVST